MDVPESLQLERLTQRDGGSFDEAKSILATQAKREERLIHQQKTQLSTNFDSLPTNENTTVQ
ncbi:MAG: dephospho-CoA kinase [Granulosicoccus sp.]